jgi:hypothetical protein
MVQDEHSSCLRFLDGWERFPCHSLALHNWLPLKDSLISWQQSWRFHSRRWCYCFLHVKPDKDCIFSDAVRARNHGAGSLHYNTFLLSATGITREPTSFLLIRGTNSKITAQIQIILNRLADGHGVPLRVSLKDC